MLPLEARQQPRPRTTPVIDLAGHGWHRLTVKDETRQHSGAFKYRGGLHRLLTRPPAGPIVAASTGNHAAGLAVAAAQLNIALTVFMPAATPAVKRDRVTAAGAAVVLVEGDYDACEAHARVESRRLGHDFVHSFDDPLIIEGHRSLFAESPRADQVYLPVGGGGLVAAGIRHWGAFASTRIVGVEYAAAPAMLRSLAVGRRVELGPVTGWPEGLLVRRVGRLGFDAARAYRLRVVTVDDEQIRLAMRLLWRAAGIRAEAAGAAAVAAALTEPHPDGTALCVVSGGNIDEEQWHAAVT